MAVNQREKQQARTKRTRLKLRKLANGRPRLSVFRSSKNISAQIIDDCAGHTLASASSLDASLREGLEKGSNADAAAKIGTAIAERAIAVGVKDVIFDRGGYMYRGRVKALAEAARDAGLKF